jgi:putative membrane-bound dehydrogenase-like protein
MRPIFIGIPLVLVAATSVVSQTSHFPKIVNTQNPKDQPPTPAETVKLITLPPGFNVTLFAGEPDVQQPIAMCFDDRGRLWVAECYTYDGKGWDAKHRDRIVIFEDTANVGRFDKRTVFWDKGQNLSSVAVGFGGVWVLCAPNLLFIPDRNGKGVPGGQPEVVLDGWAANEAGHNIVNGLMWGPDGWLYGRHGILANSYVGRPGTPKKDRAVLNCGIWRYHPTRKLFEVVCHGTTNPWGLDYDDHGQMFFTNNVNGHLWHVILGAHYKRMYGEDLRPHLYDLIDQHADHYHWDTGKSWTESRDGKGKNDVLGGGHSHCGGMIYLGDNWPDDYRNTIFMCNTHGRRLNNDRLVRKGSGYSCLHNPDFLRVATPWFRGIALLYGPDGGVYVSDWCDLGECHDYDGVHRTSGRIYKVTYGKPKPPAIADVSQLSDAELVELQLHKNDWYVRTARRVLQERFDPPRDTKEHEGKGEPGTLVPGKRAKKVHEGLRKIYDTHPDVTRKLRALWALYVTGGTEEAWLREQLGHKSEHLRVWAIKLLVDQRLPSGDTLQRFVQMGKEDSSGLVRLTLASALQRLPLEQRPALAAALLARGKDMADHNLPLMLWYGVEPLAPAMPAQALQLAKDCRIPLVRRCLARRLTEDIDKVPGPVDELVKLAGGADSADFQLDVLTGMADALRGRLKAKPPASWAAVAEKLTASPRAAVRTTLRELGVVFGDGRAITELRAMAADSQADPEGRRTALRVLLDHRPPDLLPLLKKLVADRATVAVAMRGLAAYDDPAIPGLVLKYWHFLRPEERPAAISTLAARPAYAKALLEAMADGKIARTDLSAFHARQIHSFGDEKLNQQLAKVWGEVRSTAKEKLEQINRYKKLLTPAKLKSADLSRGRLVFSQACASCHVLYGQGQHIGPDLTGSNRDNLDYLLENIIDPSAVVAADFKMSVVTLKNGRILTGIVVEPTERTLAVQTQTERVKLDREEIADVRPTSQSLMPDGLLAALSEEQVRDLVAYLMAREQVRLPGK